MGLINNLGRLYNRFVHAPRAKLLGKLTDRTDFSVTNFQVNSSSTITTAAMAIISLKLFYERVGKDLLIAYTPLVDFLDPSKEQQGLTFYDHFIDIGTGAAIAYGIIALGLGYANNWRKPVYKRLGFEPVALDPEREFSYVNAKLAELKDTPELSREETNAKVNETLDEIVQRTEGYRIEHGKKIKTLKFGKGEGTGGVVSPLSLEAAATDPTTAWVIAHEKAHQVGYLRDPEAEFMAYKTLLESTHATFQKEAYIERKRKLIWHFTKEWMEEIDEKFLYDSPTHIVTSRIFDRFESYGVKKQEAMDEVSEATRIYLRNSAAKLMERFEAKRSINKYHLKPLPFIAAYDPAPALEKAA